jgi:6-phosphogluconolactonase/glucosamine-6-phosphate isomerase/deaminase
VYNHIVRIIRRNNVGELQQIASNDLSCYIKANSDKKLLFLIACGSSLEILKHIKPNLLSPNITISVLDERFTKDPTINGFSQLQKTSFYEDALKAKCNFIESISIDDESQTQLAERINDEITKWLIDNPNGNIFATIGIGLDGHVAGIMPCSNESSLSNLLSKNIHIVPVNVGKKNKYALRVTPTLKFIKEHIDKAIVYIVGKDKRSAFIRIFDPNENIFTTPAKILLEMRNVSMFTNIMKDSSSQNRLGNKS